MKTSGIGGQAVIEGVMMKNKDVYAVAVRKPDSEIVVDVHHTKKKPVVEAAGKIPLVRGVVNFIESLVVGVRTLTYSASFYDEDETDKKGKSSGDKSNSFSENDGVMIFFTIAFSLAAAILIFMVIPYGISLLFEGFISSKTVICLIEGLIRMIVFLAYVIGISALEDIKRVFMYHGAEHKCINCIESGRELTVENVRESTRFHKRCGTSFLLFVMIISIIAFAFIRADSAWLRLLLRIVLVPVIAGISYEFIRLAGKGDNIITDVLSKPGLWLQRLTTREPTDDMIEVGMASVNAVFDWREFLRK